MALRVVAGAWGGRRLAAPTGRATRPTAERVREALFAVLGALDDQRVLDLFAGSGALGIEALSRGALHADFVDSDPGAARVLRANLTALGVSSDRARVHQMPALRALGQAGRARRAYDLVLIDPPYRDAPALGPVLDRALAPLLSGSGCVVSESDRRAPLELGLPMVDERRYGDTLIRFHEAV